MSGDDSDKVRSIDTQRIPASRNVIAAGNVSPDEVRHYLAGLTLANAFEIEELRKAPVELKLRQLCA